MGGWVGGWVPPGWMSGWQRPQLVHSTQPGRWVGGIGDLHLPHSHACRFPHPSTEPSCSAPFPLQKKSTMQFKALDNVLQTINRESGQKEALSYRCADIDRYALCVGPGCWCGRL